MKTDEKMKLVLVSGLSGAGKTHAADWFEDHGYYCIDNMPPALIRNFLELDRASSSRITHAAFVVDIRSDEFFSGLNETIDYLTGRQDIDFRILFLEASDAALLRRYNETRRQHPLTNGITSIDVIQRERSMLADLRARSNNVIDTTSMKIAEFNHEMEKVFGEGSGNDGKNVFSINIVSFGYKHGIPQDIDMIFDVRFIPNPYYVESLKNLTGNNKKVQNYVLKHDITQEFIRQLDTLINTLTPAYAREGKNHLNIAFGCTGGQHRSVTLANEMARVFQEEGFRVTLEHREL